MQQFVYMIWTNFLIIYFFMFRFNKILIDFQKFK